LKLRVVLSPCCFHVAAIISFSRWEYQSVLLLATTTSATTSTRLLRLGELSLERLGLNKGDVGARVGAGVLAVAYMLTTSPGTSLKFSSDRTVEPSTCFTPFCFRRLTVWSGPPLTE